ncbi:MAG: hypothetical protein FD123_3557 [Bacteroidetes bacterium]|nr:MAG: hypothetical protein FD123_3557 [Bacteroidota bacterium]
MKIKFLFLATAFAIALPISKAQDCAGFQKKAGCSQASEEGFMYNSQSKAGLFAPGTKSNLKVVFYGGFDYSISLCSDKIFGTAGLDFTLTDTKTGEVLYNNATDSKSQHMEFSCEDTRAVTISVTVPGTPPKKGSGKSYDGGCVGVLIEQKPTTKVGF